MVVNIKECGVTTKWKAQASFNGQMVVSMKVDGLMVNNMEQEHIHQPVEKQRKDNGKTVKE